MLFAALCSLRPTRLAIVRLNATLRVGCWNACWIRPSASPVTPRIRDSILVAKAWLVSRLGPAIWTSFGAGEPKLRICDTMSAGWNENVTPGKRASQLADITCGRRVLLA